MEAADHSAKTRMAEGVYLHYGYDFREYASSSLKRRIGNLMRDEKFGSISELQGEILHDPACFERFVVAMHTAGFVFIITLMLFVLSLDMGLISRNL